MLSADGAGTLIAMLDVHGTCSYDEFLRCVSMAPAADENAPPQQEPPPPPRALMYPL